MKHSTFLNLLQYMYICFVDDELVLSLSLEYISVPSVIIPRLKMKKASVLLEVFLTSTPNTVK